MTFEHITTEEIERDIAETEREIAQMEREADYYEKSPYGSPSYRLDHMKADSRRHGIQDRRKFIAQLQNILAERTPESAG